jgi:hypothetical protein
MNRISLFFLCAALPLHVFAHPGHGSLEHGVSHLLASPFHISFLLAPAFVLLAVVRFVTHPRARSLIYWSATALFVLAAIQAVKVII